ncbi:MAG TPA: DegT/DnrJ/EryC1/StrS family aminotransferase, partial [Accumulibacter sp.]|nr:DegT/DnrJ/EryC1/StrS family aminotransferase [Accumulibacter sp.]
LAPAYHCVTMIDPALALSATVCLYRLKADLSPDIEHLHELVANAEQPVKAVLATHYFGLIQDFKSLAEFCRARQILLIEDCSHVLFTENFQAPGSGIHGDLVIASPYKFFSCADGGLLYSREESRLDSVHTENPSFLDELVGIKHTYEKSRWGTSTDRIPDIDSLLDSLASTRLAAGKDLLEERQAPSDFYSINLQNRSSLRYSRLMVRQSSPIENARKRQQNFTLWTSAIAQTPNCRAVFSQLPQDSIPYMFPVYIDRPYPDFYRLKHLGVPIWRWDEMGASSCAISEGCRLHLLHLPCHQALTSEQLAWMTTTFNKAMHLTTKGNQ